MKCKNCQKELTKKQTAYCSNECKAIFQSIAPKIKSDETKIYKCKIDGKEFSAGSLRSGAMKKYSTNVLVKDFDINDWELIDKPENNDQYWNCPHCDWKGKSKEGRDNGGWIGKHLETEHGIDKISHVNQFPNDSILWPVRLQRAKRLEDVNSNLDSQIKCMECGQLFRKISNSHLKTHNLTEFEYKAKHGQNSLSSISFRKRMSELYYQNDKMQSKLSRSKYEDELCNLFKLWNIKVESNNKKLLQTDLDIFLSEFNLAIEFNGLYYHSELGGEKFEQYHLNKTKKCEENGVHLIHIFEDEWVNKKEIVISRLKNLVGKNDTVIYARKCEIREVSFQDAAQFLNNNHLQGSNSNMPIRFGLYYNNDLVSLMVFSKPRNSTGNKVKNDHEWELLRFCNKLNCSVVGGASKLFKHFETNVKPVKITSFADRRWTSTLKDSLYDEIGFTLISKGSPNYWYLVENMKRHHRFNFTKQRILKVFLDADPNESEWQNMINLGFDRIWDCGSLKYEKSYTDSVISNLTEPLERNCEIVDKPKRRRKRKETTRNISDVECQICKNSYSIVGIASHFKLNHNLTVDEYVSKYSEYRPQKIKENKNLESANGEYECKICNFQCRNEKHLSIHIPNVHNISKTEYVIQYILDGKIPKCKCGCGNEVGILTAKPYFREFLSGHNSKGELNNMSGKTHSHESKLKMMGQRTRIKK